MPLSGKSPSSEDTLAYIVLQPRWMPSSKSWGLAFALMSAKESEAVALDLIVLQESLRLELLSTRLECQAWEPLEIRDSLVCAAAGK